MSYHQLIRDRDRYARHLGISIISAADGAAEVQMTVAEHHLNGMDMAHGGAIFSLCDLAFALACNSYDAPAVALNVSINYMQVGKLGDVLRASAREVSRTRRVGTYEVLVRNVSGEILASFHGLAYIKGAQ